MVQGGDTGVGGGERELWWWWWEGVCGSGWWWFRAVFLWVGVFFAELMLSVLLSVSGVV